MKSNQRSYQLEGLSEKIFLDRYAWKDADSNHAKVGDVVLVLTKDDPKFPTKEVGEIIERKGQLVQVRTRSGEMIETNVEKLTLNIEKTPEEMWDRLAKAMASVESTADQRATWESKFRSVLEDWKLVPGGRIAAGAGASDELTLFNCYVIPSPQDSRGGIMKTLTEMTEIMARGGGVGINLSSLRPRRAVVKGVNGSSSGSVSWGGLFSYTTGLIEQGGSRRGALMLMMNDWHPDVLDFITVKQTMGQVTNANLSVCVSNAFMEAVKQDGDWDLVFPDTNDPDYDTEWNGDMQQWKAAGHSVVHYRTLKARKIWHTIIESAWKSAEPGVVFMEYYNQMSNSWYFNPIICTNPCGEQGLPGWGVCNLSAINLSKFYDETNHDVAWDELAETTRISARFLDNVIDATPYHFEENRLNQQRERRVGLGTMGLAELMIKLRIRYGSPESLAFLDKLYGFMAKEAYLASAEIAAEKGAFPAFEAEPYLQSGFMKNMVATYPEVGEAIRKQGIRNVTLITQAPTGSTGTMVGTSTGIEPYFAFKYFRQSRLGYDEQFVPIAQDWLDEHPGEALPDYYVTAMDLSAENHIRVQAAIQQWVDSSISKTANCPADFTVEDTAELYELAFDLGCKGVTIYRDGSRDVQVLSTSKKEATQAEDQNTAEAEEKTVVSAIENPNNAEVQASDGTSNSQVGVRAHSSDQTPSSSTVLDKQYRNRPQVLRGATYKINTPFGMAY
ncbi:adenosylcobalamin-dependent ribonucleoside-diphosphate reductase, partial [Paenibacillus sp.]